MLIFNLFGELVSRSLRKTRYVFGDKICLQLLYLWYNHRWLNLKNPASFNEKICYRCLNPVKNSDILADKYEVKKFVAQKVGKQILVPNILLTENLTQAEFDDLPQKFIIKPTHGSGSYKIVKDKSRVDFKELKAETDKWLKQNYAVRNMEKHYNNIKPRLLVEKLLENEQGDIPADHRFHCFNKNGQTKIYPQVVTDRHTSTGLATTSYFMNQNFEPMGAVMSKFTSGFEPLKKPKNLDKMLDIAKKLSAGYGYLRVDLYLLGEEIYFSELTFTPSAGLTELKPFEFNLYLGSLWGEDEAGGF